MKKWHLLKAALLLGFILAPPASLAFESAVVSTEHVTVTLVSEQSNIEPGQTFWIGLHFELIPHWHIYWRNPGASGSAPVIRWTLPEGWEVGEVHWPVPKRIRVGPLSNYGYEDGVVLLVPVQVPPSPLLADSQIITADAEWLVCRVECIPESGRLTLELGNVGNDSSATDETRELFNATRALWPEAMTQAGNYLLDDDTLAISVAMTDAMTRSPADVWFAATEWGPVDASGAQRWAHSTTGFTLSVPAGDLPPDGNSPLEGLLVME